MWILIDEETIICDVHVIDYVALYWFHFGWFALWRRIAAIKGKM